MARPQLEHITTIASRSFVYKIDRDIWPVYHYHPEIDILLSLKDQAGEFISGDHIGRLEKGTLFMNGPNIPHALHSNIPDENDWAHPSLAVIQFSPESLGKELMEKAEMQVIRQFLDNAKFGFEFYGGVAEEAAERILAMEHKNELQRFTEFLLLLQLFAETTEKRPLASSAYSPSLKESHISRLDEVLTFLQRNKQESLTLAKVASVAKMSPKSFCRFFKSNTGKTLIEYLNELRIGDACRKLLESDRPVSEVAFDCGFQNLSHFNRRFKALKEITPGEFRKQFKIEAANQLRDKPLSIAK